MGNCPYASKGYQSKSGAEIRAPRKNFEETRDNLALHLYNGRLMCLRCSVNKAMTVLPEYISFIIWIIGWEEPSNEVADMEVRADNIDLAGNG